MILHAHLILSYNHPQLTQKCLTQLLTLAPASQIYLIHNGSRSDCINQLKNANPQIQHLVREDNAGFSAGANFGIQTLFDRGIDWIFFHTNDTQSIMLPNEPLDLLAPGLYAPILYKRQTQSIDSVGGFIHQPSQKPQHIKSHPAFASLYSHYQIGIQNHIPYIPGTAFLIHKRCWQQIGTFDEAYHTYWEDIDWCYRALKQNIYFGTLPNWILQHGIGKTCHKKSFYTQELFPQNRQKFFTKFNL